jgi:hypothetical protein
MWKSAGRAPFLRVLPWHLPYNWGKTRKNLSQGKKNLSQVKKTLSQSTVYILPKHSHITKPSQTHTLRNPNTHTHTHTHTHPHITKQYKTTTVQYCLFCVVFCIVCVYMCTVLLPPGGYPIAVKKYIISTLYLKWESRVLTRTVWLTWRSTTPQMLLYLRNAIRNVCQSGHSRTE